MGRALVRHWLSVVALLACAHAKGWREDRQLNRCWKLQDVKEHETAVLEKTIFTGTTGDHRARCLHGNSLNNGYEYVYNNGRGTPAAACGAFSEYWCCRRPKEGNNRPEFEAKLRAKGFTTRLIASDYPTQVGSDEEKCLNGNKLDDGWEYTFNTGRGKANARCGQNADYNCCKRPRIRAVQDCLSMCYPETDGRPCDGNGPTSGHWRCQGQAPPRGMKLKTAAPKPPALRCDCRWGPVIKQYLESCKAPPDRGAARFTPVFAPGDGGISCFRIPAIVQTPKGTLLAFAEARHNGCADGGVHEIALKVSRDYGRSWSPVRMVAGGQHHHVGNPYPIALSSGRVVLIYMNHTEKGAHCCQSGIDNGMVISDDEGQTWSSNVDVGKTFGNARGASPGPGSGVELNDSKRLLLVTHHGQFKHDHITMSDDGGHDWFTIKQSFHYMDEGVLEYLGNGELLLNMRHEKEWKGRAVSRSKDRGATWSGLSFDPALIGPNCQGSLAAIGGHLYFSNPNSKHNRAHLTIKRSVDGGHTWDSQLEIQAGGSAGYSSLVRGAVGDSEHGGIIYESSRPGGIDFTTFRLDMQPEFDFGAIVMQYGNKATTGSGFAESVDQAPQQPPLRRHSLLVALVALPGLLIAATVYQAHRRLRKAGSLALQQQDDELLLAPAAATAREVEA